MIRRLLSWLDARTDARIARHVEAAQVMPLPPRRRCAVCTALLPAGEPFLCVRCKADSA